MSIDYYVLNEKRLKFEKLETEEKLNDIYKLLLEIEASLLELKDKS